MTIDESDADAPRSVERPPERPTVLRRLLALFSPKTLGRDSLAGVVLGVESVPDGLAGGLLAGLNPVAGLYAYLFGMVGAAFFTSSSFLTVQATGAMALVVADARIAQRPDPAGALSTLAILTGIIMLVAGLIGAGRLLRFVPSSVMTGFITAVGVNIVLGQLGNLTGYAAQGDGRVLRTLDLFVHIVQVSWPTVVVGLVTTGGIYLLQRTALGTMGLVVAVVVGSLLAVWFDRGLGLDVALVSDIADVPKGLPGLSLPAVSEVVPLLVPALSLAFVGLVQGAAASGAFRNPDGLPADQSRDFIGQGAGNLLSGLFQGMPVGGSMSASALVVASGARTRLALFIAGGVMAAVILLLSGLVSYVAMPALAALLIVVGLSAIKPPNIVSVWRTGVFPFVVMVITFVLTIVIPLQFAVLVGVGLGILSYVAEQSNRLRVVRLEVHGDRRIRESAPPATVPARSVLVLQPYGSLFFASAPTFGRQLPVVLPSSRGSVVILRFRGVDQLGLALIDVLRQYANQLSAARSTLKIIVADERLRHQLEREGLEELIGENNVYVSQQWLGLMLRRAYDDAASEVAAAE